MKKEETVNNENRETANNKNRETDNSENRETAKNENRETMKILVYVHYQHKATSITDFLSQSHCWRQNAS